MNEFELIRRYFDRPAGGAIELGIGDDCALLRVPEGELLAVSTDTLVAGRHFLDDVDPFALGHKALAVNLSDLAAMGAAPLGCVLALTVPEALARDDAWLAAFAEGFRALAADAGCPLAGGDTTAGPLVIGVTVFGHVDAARALRRDRARVDDDIWVSGTLGDAAYALSAIAHGRDDAAALGLRERLERPQPRLALGRALLGIAHAAIDLSDGLAGDLRHVLRASGVGAIVDLEAIPLSTPLAALDRERAAGFALAGGDDYELCFTAPCAQRDAVARAAQQGGVACTRIGRIVEGDALTWIDRGRPVDGPAHGHVHFA